MTSYYIHIEIEHLAAEADDRPTLMLTEMSLQGVDVILGCLLGGLLPTLLAVLLGIYMEGSLIDSRHRHPRCEGPSM